MTEDKNVKHTIIKIIYNQQLTNAALLDQWSIRMRWVECIDVKTSFETANSKKCFITANICNIQYKFKDWLSIFTSMKHCLPHF
jgi:hypothetical protein